MLKRIGKEMHANAPDGCTCEWTSTDGKGWTLATPCPVCAAQMAAEGARMAKERERQEIVNQLNLLDQKAIRPLLDGETERVTAIKAEKEALRERLKTL
jgi:hypothetical protein